MNIDISLKDILKDTSFPKGGSILFEIAKEIIESGNTICLDMEGIESFPTVFMNTSFGDLINIFGISQTKQSFRFKNVTKMQIDRIRKYFNDYEVITKEKNKVDGESGE